MLAFVVAYSLELDSVTRLLCDLFTLIRVYCLPCIWLYDRLKLLFAAPFVVVCHWWKLELIVCDGVAPSS